MSTCVLCGTRAIINEQESASRKIYNCPNCGVFVVSDLVSKEVEKYSDEIKSFLMMRKLAKKSDTVLISFERANLDKDYLQMTVPQIVDTYPREFQEQLEGALENLAAMSKFPGDEIKIDDVDISPLLFVRDSNVFALAFMIRALHQAGLIDVNSKSGQYLPCTVVVSPHGYHRIAEIKESRGKNDILYAVFSIDNKEKTDIIEKTMQKVANKFKMEYSSTATTKATKLITLDTIASIKHCNHVICDFTNANAEVYYAAALARGLGKTLVMTCHDSAKSKLELDIEQFSVSTWDKPDSLYNAVASCIRAQSR